MAKSATEGGDKNTLYDLCEYDCGVKVCCSTVSCNDYEPENLINKSVNSKGFLAEYFVSPPISIYFHFPFPVRLHEVVFEAAKGLEGSSEYSLSGGSHAPLSEMRCSAECKVSSSSNVSNLDVIGKGGCLSNGLARFTTKYSSHDPGHQIRSRDNPSVLTRMTLLKISIVRSRGIKAHGIRNLKILCCPSNIEDQKMLDSSKRTSAIASTSGFNFFGGGGCADDKVDESRPTSSSSSCDKINTVDGKDDLSASIPSDFLDEITYEVMEIPMVLPSGKHVDLKTLEKCNASTMTYGRLPLDPFTGKPYDGTLKPQFNSALKSRIDRFFLENSHLSPQNRGRTVGSAADIAEFLKRKDSLKRSPLVSETKKEDFTNKRPKI